MLWDLESGRALLTLEASGVVSSLTFSPDGKKLASAGEGTIAQIWDVQTGALLATKSGGQGHTQEILDLAFSPDGTVLASASRDRSAKIWHVKTQKLVATLEDPALLAEPTVKYTEGVLPPAARPDEIQQIVNVAFSPNGKLIATAVDQGAGTMQPAFYIRLWDAQNYKLAPAPDAILQSVRINQTFGSQSLAFSPDGSILATALRDNRIKLWNTANNLPVTSISLADRQAVSVAFATDGSIIAAGMDDGSVRLWDASSLQLLAVLKGGLSDRLVFNPDGTTLAAYGSASVPFPDPKKGLIFWDLKLKIPGDLPIGFPPVVSALAFNHDGSVVATGMNNLALWDTQTGQMILTLPNDFGHQISSIIFSPDGSLLAASSGANIRVWSIAGALP